jgi:hypothetical protein
MKTNKRFRRISSAILVMRSYPDEIVALPVPVLVRLREKSPAPETVAPVPAEGLCGLCCVAAVTLNNTAFAIDPGNAYAEGSRFTKKTIRVIEFRFLRKCLSGENNEEHKKEQIPPPTP